MNAVIAASALTPSSLSPLEQLGFDLGWDHAHYSVAPPLPCLEEPSSLRSGYLAGRAVFGARVLRAGRPVQMWLQLRLHAWLHGQSVEPVQVTPHYLAQLVVTHCPITRARINAVSLLCREAVIARVRPDAAYAAGNLAVMSAKASQARCRHGWQGAMQFARGLESGLPSGFAGLNSEQWARLAVLGSLVESMPHAQACELPLLVLPPNRLRLFNPAQALQAFVSRQLLKPGWSLRISRIEALLPGKAARRAFQTFFHALLPRVLEAGNNIALHELRWAIEDAWRHPLVMQRWGALAHQLSALECKALVLRAHAKRLGQCLLQEIDDSAATDGWNLASPRTLDDVVAGRRDARRRSVWPEPDLLAAATRVTSSPQAWSRGVERAGPG